MPDFAAPATTSNIGWPFKIHAAIIADSSVYVPSSYDGCSTDSYTTSTKNMEFLWLNSDEKRYLDMELY